ncbi:NAD(P)/FAD-dependent oxidoreductase [Tropicimonas sp. IMCC34011]|uniref:FAD/NAD(P)-dependent oxidoreductase n=1 Tax=Tropicimonas sp. IMCC34011 TaxID=2248759 RepID=UPI000E2631D1|nr:NAD(P)/FAD-dependent oxidoreductase [Tropicimonas sp. IMCC34011]
MTVRPADADLIIIGAGPAGLAAADEARRYGARVILLDEQPTPGGQIYRNVLSATPGHDRLLGRSYSSGRSLANTALDKRIDYRSGAVVWKASAEGSVWYSSKGRSCMVTGRHLLLATGALERPVPVPGWTLPGVMTAGAAQILLKSAGTAPRDAVLVGSGPLLYLLARQLLAAGFPPKAIVDTRSGQQMRSALRHAPGALRSWRVLYEGLRLIWSLRKSGVAWFRGAEEARIEGTDTANAVAFRHGGRQHRIETQIALLHQGVVPNTQLSRSLGLPHCWDESQLCFRPQTNAYGMTPSSNISIAGDGAGILGAKAAEFSGRITALGALSALGMISEPERDRLARPYLRQRGREAAIRPFLETLYAPPDDILCPVGETVVCRCEGVTAKDVRRFADLGYHGPNQLKAFCRCGMGPCQGRYCGLTVTNLLAMHHKLHHEQIGYFRVRSPIKPITLAELAGGVSCSGRDQ